MQSIHAGNKLQCLILTTPVFLASREDKKPVETKMT